MMIQVHYNLSDNEKNMKGQILKHVTKQAKSLARLPKTNLFGGNKI